MTREEPPPSRGASGISLRTLAIASIASALAAYLVQMIWRPGTLLAAAAMPVLVALLSEAISRPAAHVSQVGVQVTRVGQRVVTRRQPREPAEPGTAGDAIAEARRRRRTRIALVTGLLGFVLVGVAWTSAELVTGESLFGGERRTTYFGGEVSEEPEVSEERDESSETTPAPDATATPPGAEPAETPTPEAEETPAPEATQAPPPAGAEPTPAPQASPAPVLPAP